MKNILKLSFVVSLLMNGTAFAQYASHLVGQPSFSANSNTLLFGNDTGNPYSVLLPFGAYAPLVAPQFTGPVTVNGTLQSTGSLVTVQTGNYTLASTDCGTTVWDRGATAAHTYTIPNTLPVGCRIVINQTSSNNLTLTNAANELLNYYNFTTNTSNVPSATAGSTTISFYGQADSRVVMQKTSTYAIVSVGQ